MKTLHLVPSGSQATLGSAQVAQAEAPLVLPDSQACLFLETIAQKSVFEKIEGELTVQGGDEEVRKVLKVMFASLKEFGKVELKLKSEMFGEGADGDQDRLRSFLKVVGFQSVELESAGQSLYRVTARKPEVVAQPAPPKIRRKNQNQVAGSSSQAQPVPASNPWASLGQPASGNGAAQNVTTNGGLTSVSEQQLMKQSEANAALFQKTTK